MIKSNMLMPSNIFLGYNGLGAFRLLIPDRSKMNIEN